MDSVAEVITCERPEAAASLGNVLGRTRVPGELFVIEETIAPVGRSNQ